jgi:hypothetical protein
MLPNYMADKENHARQSKENSTETEYMKLTEFSSLHQNIWLD